MAMVYNPITKQMEDDGLGEAPAVSPLVDNAIPPEPVAPPVGGQMMAVDGVAAPGATPDNPVHAVIAPTPKPPVVVESGTQRTLESKGEKLAAQRMAAAETAVGIGLARQGRLEVDEAKVDEQVAQAKIEALQAEKARNAEIEQKEKQELETRAARERALVEDRAKKQIAAGRARADFFKGSFVGEIVAALVQSVAAGFHAEQGKSGLSPAERIFEQKYADHEKALLAEYEASAQAKKDFDEDRPRWEAERAARRVRAANEAQHDMKMALAVADRATAKLAPDKAAAATAMKQALEERANAKAELGRMEGLRVVKKYSETRHPMGSGTGDGSGLAAVGGLNPVLDPDTMQPIAQLPKERMVEGRQQREKVAALGGLRKWNDAFKNFLSQHGPVASKWSPETRNQFQTFATEGAGLLTTANQTGVLNDGEYKRYISQMTPDGIIGLFTSKEANERGLDEIVRGARRKVAGTTKSLVPAYDDAEPGTKPKPGVDSDAVKKKHNLKPGSRFKIGDKTYQLNSEGKAVPVQ